MRKELDCLINWKVKAFKVRKCSDDIFTVLSYEAQPYPSHLCSTDRDDLREQRGRATYILETLLAQLERFAGIKFRININFRGILDFTCSNSVATKIL